MRLSRVGLTTPYARIFVSGIDHPSFHRLPTLPLITHMPYAGLPMSSLQCQHSITPSSTDLHTLPSSIAHLALNLSKDIGGSPYSNRSTDASTFTQNRNPTSPADAWPCSIARRSSNLCPFSPPLLLVVVPSRNF